MTQLGDLKGRIVTTLFVLLGTICFLYGLGFPMIVVVGSIILAPMVAATAILHKSPDRILLTLHVTWVSLIISDQLLRLR